MVGMQLQVTLVPLGLFAGSIDIICLSVCCKDNSELHLRSFVRSTKTIYLHGLRIS